MEVAYHHRQDNYLTALQQFHAEALKISDIDRLWATAIDRVSGFLQMAPVCSFLPFSSGEDFQLVLCSASGLTSDPSFSGFKPSGTFIRWLKDHDVPLSWPKVYDEVVSPSLAQDERHLLAEIQAAVCFAVKDMGGEISGVVVLKHRVTPGPYTELEIHGVALMLILLSSHLKRIQLEQACHDIKEQIKTARDQFAAIETLDATLQMFRQIAHSFNTLLTGIIGRSELALGEKEAEKIKRQVLSMEKAAEGGQARVQEARDLIEEAAAQVGKLSDNKPKEALDRVEQLINIIYPHVDAMEERDGIKRNKDTDSG
jgi:hypothetical protein